MHKNQTHLIIFLTCSGGISSFCVSTNPNFLLSPYRFEFSCIHLRAFSSSLASASAGDGKTVYEGWAAGGGGIVEPPVPGGAIWPLFHMVVLWLNHETLSSGLICTGNLWKIRARDLSGELQWRSPRVLGVLWWRGMDSP